MSKNYAFPQAFVRGLGAVPEGVGAVAASGAPATAHTPHVKTVPAWEAIVPLAPGTYVYWSTVVGDHSTAMVSSWPESWTKSGLTRAMILEQTKKVPLGSTMAFRWTPTGDEFAFIPMLNGSVLVPAGVRANNTGAALFSGPATTVLPPTIFTGSVSTPAAAT
jgi:hypothetical protein